MDPLSIYIFRPDIYSFYQTGENGAQFPTTAIPEIFNSNLRNNRYIDLDIWIEELTETTLTFLLRSGMSGTQRTVTLFFPLNIADYPIFQLHDNGKYVARSSLA